jgi:AraC-like DNA-binding protein
LNAIDLGFTAGYIEELQLYGAHHHNDVELVFLASGQLLYAFAGKHIPLPSNRLAIFWAAIPHRLIRVAPNTKFYWITIPLNVFYRWDLPNGLIKCVLDAEFVEDMSGESTANDQYAFRQWYTDISSGNRVYGKTALLEIEARVRRLADGFSAERPAPVLTAPGNNPRLQTAQQIALFIANHYTEQIDGTTIAAAVGVHPGYASRVFASVFNIGVIDYLTQYRVAAAQKMLLMTEYQVKTIAFEVGFGSISRFYASFKKLCGMSPERYRLKLMGKLDEASISLDTR